jgi:hypothetical protein
LLRCSWLCTLPQVLRQLCSSQESSRAYHPLPLFESEHGILHRTEIAVPSLVPGLGRTSSCVDQQRCQAVVFGVKQVTILRGRGGLP